MKALRIITAIFTALALTVAGLLFYVHSHAVDAELYVNAIEHAGIYEDIEERTLNRFVYTPIDGIQTSRLRRKALREEGEELVRDILPREWQRETTEAALTSFIAYLTGEQTSFEVTIPLADRADTALQTLAQRLPGSAAYEYIYNGFSEKLGRDFAAKHNKNLPLGIELGALETRDYARKAMPQDWMAEQLVEIFDAMRPYATGEQAHFIYRVPLQERETAFVEIIKTLIERGDAYNFLIENAVAPAISQNLDTIIELPFGVQLADSDVLEAFKQVVSEEWVLARKNEILAQGADYLTGRSDRLVIVIPLADRKKLAMQKLSMLVDQRLQRALAEMPRCSPVQLLHAINQPDEPLACSPPGSSLSASKDMLGLRVTEQVEAKIGAALPDQWTYDTQSMRQQVGSETWDTLQLIRTWLRKGIPVSDANLRRFLDPEQADSLDQLLVTSRTGITLDQAWLDATLSASQRDRVDELRELVDNIASARWLALLIAVILLGIWWAMRRDAPTRRLRDGGLLIAGISITLIALGLAVRSSLHRLLPDKIALGPTLADIETRLPEALHHLADAWMDGLLGLALVFFIIGLLTAMGSHAALRNAEAEAS